MSSLILVLTVAPVRPDGLSLAVTGVFAGGAAEVRPRRRYLQGGGRRVHGDDLESSQAEVPGSGSCQSRTRDPRVVVIWR